jgi:alkylation response protein AidB-like acyl-CoA dehydrogenase
LHFGFSDEQEELRVSMRRFLEDKSPETEVRRLMETAEGYDPAVWGQMAEQLSLLGLIVPEAYGGLGYGYVELIVVLEEMGRALLCSPYFSTVALATNLLLASGDEAACADYLPGVAAGSTIATAAVAEDSGRGQGRGHSPGRSVTSPTGTSRTWCSSPPGPRPACRCSRSAKERKASSPSR